MAADSTPTAPGPADDDVSIPSPVPALDSLRIRSRARSNLRPLLAGQGISLFGDYLAFFTLPVYVVELTGRASDLGLTAAAETLPTLLFGLGAGVILDRTVLRRSLILTDAARAIVFLLLAAAVALDTASVWMVFGAAFIVGSMSVIFDAGLEALLPVALTEDLLVTANSRLQLLRSIAMVVGPAFAGILVAGEFGFQLAFLINAATFLVSATYLTAVRGLRTRARIEERDFANELKDGLRFLLKQPVLRAATAGALAANLVFAPLAATIFLFGEAELGLGTLQLGPISIDELGIFIAGQALIGVGGVSIAPAVAARIRLGRMFIAGMILLGSGFLVTAFMDGLVAVIPAGIGFAGITWLNVAASTLRQQLSPDELAGRVIAASRTLAWMGIPAGAAAGGFLGDAIGLQSLFVACSIGVLLVAGLLLATPLARPAAGPAAQATAGG